MLNRDRSASLRWVMLQLRKEKIVQGFKAISHGFRWTGRVHKRIQSWVVTRKVGLRQLTTLKCSISQTMLFGELWRARKGVGGGRGMRWSLDYLEFHVLKGHVTSAISVFYHQVASFLWRVYDLDRLAFLKNHFTTAVWRKEGTPYKHKQTTHLPTKLPISARAIKVQVCQELSRQELLFYFEHSEICSPVLSAQHNNFNRIFNTNLKFKFKFKFNTNL